MHDNHKRKYVSDPLFEHADVGKAIIEYLLLCWHYFATTLLERGVDIVTISSILGHSKMMTSLLYSHTDKGKRRRRSRA
ncbi:MAG: hypothetical protein E4G89_00475 [Methanothrix sp.]|nr:MAG: hypothetical protein E4G89_00475 [Methanothrix sp.]